MALGIWLFSTLTLQTSELSLGFWMVILGFGIGLMLQVPTLAVQNSVPFEQMGAGTATATFARSIGSSFGGAIFGTVLITSLNSHLHILLPNIKSTAINASSLSGGTASLAKIPLKIRHDVLQAFVLAFHDLFLYVIPITLITLLVTFFLKDAHLRESSKEYAEGEGFKLSEL